MRNLIKEAVNQKVIQKLLNFMTRHPEMTPKSAENLFRNYATDYYSMELYPDDLLRVIKKFVLKYGEPPKYLSIVDITAVVQLAFDETYAFIKKKRYYYFSVENRDDFLAIQMKGRLKSQLPDKDMIHYIGDEDYEEDRKSYFANKYGVKKIEEGTVLETDIRFSCEF